MVACSLAVITLPPAPLQACARAKLPRHAVAIAAKALLPVSGSINHLNASYSSAAITLNQPWAVEALREMSPVFVAVLRDAEVGVTYRSYQ